MKTKILTIIMFAAALGCFAYNDKDAPASPPTHVINALNNLRELYADKDRITYRREVDRDNNSLISSVEIIPFECPMGQGILTEVKAAFMEDKNLAYSFDQMMPGEPGRINVGTSDYNKDYISTRDRTEQEYISMYVKNANNPELRDCYAVVWEKGSSKSIPGVDKDGFELRGSALKEWKEKNYDIFKGKIYIITSRLPDLRKDSDKSATFGSQIKKPAALNSAVTKVGGETIGKRLNAYKELLEIQENEIKKLQRDYQYSTNPSEKRTINKRLRQLHKQAQGTINDMKKLIKEVSKY